MSSGSQWVRAERVLWRRTPQGVVVLGGDAADPVLITGAGVLIWELLENPIAPDELSDALGQIHGMPPATILGEITPVVEELVRLGVLATCP